MDGEWGVSHILVSLQGCSTSEKSQAQRRHLASARLCQAAKQTASLLRGGRAGSTQLAVPDQGAVSSAHALRSSSGQPCLGWAGGRCKTPFLTAS